MGEIRLVVNADGSVDATCDGCAATYAVDVERPLVLQIWSIADAHHCEVPIPQQRADLDSAESVSRDPGRTSD